MVSYTLKNDQFHSKIVQVNADHAGHFRPLVPLKGK